MGLKKGQTNNMQGRPKGRKNKNTDELRQIIQSFIDNNIDNMQESFDQIQPKEKLLFMEKMLQYALPKISSVAPDGDKGDHKIIIEYV